MNIYFHDNSYSDNEQLNDIDRTDWILKTVLVNEYNNSYVVREYRYKEICYYHKTLVTDFSKDNHFVKLSQIPSVGRYWIAIDIQDPYGRKKDSGFVD